ncbi:conserved hypothetical protein [Ixodes scapularis]|uniref:glycerophosphocholine cholinephosphodiesterase n=1 Tax=Ixodes scapularis TaxID=6945 RepID=B7P2C8_IXOSC|nr:conserved hypothetical protein [Ixodes scapularis]|eukprot:XP_002402137.1 conserved hypothetical protein [Ixodes scapularis]
MRRSTSMSALHAFLLALAASLGGLCGAKTLATGGTPPRVILILVDGVRWDYLDEPQLPGFTALARDGVKAKYVVPIMPANSYPNWYSIVTGESVRKLTLPNPEVFLGSEPTLCPF